MRIIDLLDEACINLDACPADKDEAIDLAVALMEKSGAITDAKKYKELVLKREQESSTGIGGGVAIPHGKGDVVQRPAVAILVIKDGVDFDAVDDAPVQLLFMIAAPEHRDDLHVDVLRKLSKLLVNETFVENLKNAVSAHEILKIMDQADRDLEKNSVCVDERKMILAVTSCPTGIAHTYMAAEALEIAAHRLNYTIKVETRGASGVHNELSKEDIEKADCIIVAADIQVPMERFYGKRLIRCSVSDGIHKAEQLLETIRLGEAPVYKERKKYDNSPKRKSIFGHLMHGISHMLPFAVAGGVLIALTFLLKTVDNGLLASVTSVLKQIGDAALWLMFPVFSGFIATSIADRPGLCVGFVGGLLTASGKSGFIGALVVGFLAGYVVVLLKLCFQKLPQWLEKISPVLFYPLLGVFIVGIITLFIIDPVVGVLNSWLIDVLNSMNLPIKIMFGCVLAGMMAVDMGGPVNKTAYVLGVASLALGNYDFMPAVMIGGMVPPCAIALGTLLFKNRFTCKEHRLGLKTCAMGLMFITEGAIPYMMEDRIPVVVSCVVGGVVSGGLCMALGCTLMTPHGGILVVPIMNNGVEYLYALIAGTIVGALMLGILKKKV